MHDIMGPHTKVRKISEIGQTPNHAKFRHLRQKVFRCQKFFLPESEPKFTKIP